MNEFFAPAPPDPPGTVNPTEAPPPLLEDESLPLELREALASLGQVPPVADDDPILAFIDAYAAELDTRPAVLERDPTEAPAPLHEDESLPPDLRQALTSLRDPAPIADDDPMFAFIDRMDRELQAEEEAESRPALASSSSGEAASAGAEGASVVPLEAARDKRRKKKKARDASDRPASGKGPKASEPSNVVSLGAWLRARPWVMPLTAAAALVVIYLATRPREDLTASGRDDYPCEQLPMSKLEVAQSIGPVSEKEAAGIYESREQMRSEPAKAIARLETDQQRYGGVDQNKKLLWQEREALIIHGLQCTGKPFRERAREFLEASPKSSFVESVKKDLAAGKPE